MTELNTLVSLLNHVRSIKDKYIKPPGENFNIFKVLGLTSNEVRTHSAFIAELLNPDGSHGLSDIFIKIFIDILNKKLKPGDVLNFDSGHIKEVKVEFWIGYKTETTGGYIDILLTDKSNRQIIIENKIYAGDQENQLLRYHNYNKSAQLIYLTLDGREPSVFSTNNNPEIKDKLICLSYKNDILTWLEYSRKATVGYSLLRETITQYINLVKHLTNQTMEEKEKNEIIELISKNKDYMEVIAMLHRNDIWLKVREKILSGLGHYVIGETGLSKDLGLIVKYNSKKGFGKKDFDFWYYKPDWKYCIYFLFDNDFETLFYGIDIVNSQDKMELVPNEKFSILLQNVGTRIPDENWVWKSRFTEYDQMSWFDLPQKGQNLFKNKIIEMMERTVDFM